MSVAHGEHLQALEEHSAGGHGLNWWGMVFFIASEALIFANLIAAYLYLEVRGFQVKDGLWLLPSGEHLPVLFPAINTVFLLASSFPAIYARRSITKGNQRGLVLGLIGAIALGVIFLCGQAYEYFSLFGEGFTLGYRTFGSAFFTLTGFHGLHVTIGVIILIVCLIRALRGDFTANKHFAVEAGEMYWHFVDGVWIVVFSTVYLLPLLMIR
jgi:cytochrome c oxidase subunit III